VPKPQGEAQTIFTFTVFNRTSCTYNHLYLLGLLDTWQYDYSKRRKVLIQPHNATSQRICILSSTAEKTSNIAGPVDFKSKMDLPLTLNAFDEQMRTLTLRFKMC